MYFTALNATLSLFLWEFKRFHFNQLLLRIPPPECTLGFSGELVDLRPLLVNVELLFVHLLGLQEVVRGALVKHLHVVILRTERAIRK